MSEQTTRQQLIAEQDRLIRYLEHIKYKASLSGPDAQDAWDRLIERYEKRLHRLQEISGHSVQNVTDTVTF